LKKSGKKSIKMIFLTCVEGFGANQKFFFCV
jgi:hypothetical protein